MLINLYVINFVAVGLHSYAHVGVDDRRWRPPGSRTRISRSSWPRSSAAGELHRVTVPVDPTLEISEIVTRTVRARRARRCCSSGRPGATCRWRSTCSAPHRRMAMALGVDDVDEIGDRIGELVKPELPVGWSGIREGLGKLLQLKSVPPKKVQHRALPGGRLQGSRGRPGPAARAADLAGRRRHLPQLRADPHQAPGDRQAQPRPVPAAAARPEHARPALADPQGLDRPPRGRRAARRAAAGRGRDRLRPGRLATPRPRRCRATSTSTCSPASCGASGSRWSTA